MEDPKQAVHLALQGEQLAVVGRFEKKPVRQVGQVVAEVVQDWQPVPQAVQAPASKKNPDKQTRQFVAEHSWQLPTRAEHRAQVLPALR